MRHAHEHWDHEEACQELRDNAGTQFDPEVIDALLDLLGHNAPSVPDRSRDVKLAAAPPRPPTGRSKGWAPGA